MGSRRFLMACGLVSLGGCAVLSAGGGVQPPAPAATEAAPATGNGCDSGTLIRLEQDGQPLTVETRGPVPNRHKYMCNVLFNGTLTPSVAGTFFRSRYSVADMERIADGAAPVLDRQQKCARFHVVLRSRPGVMTACAIGTRTVKTRSGATLPIDVVDFTEQADGFTLLDFDYQLYFVFKGGIPIYAGADQGPRNSTELNPRKTLMEFTPLP